MSKNDERCENCQFACADVKDLAPDVPTGIFFDCRRHAPVLHGAGTLGVWPQVCIGLWCGDWASREAA